MYFVYFGGASLLRSAFCNANKSPPNGIRCNRGWFTYEDAYPYVHETKSHRVEQVGRDKEVGHAAAQRHNEFRFEIEMVDRTDAVGISANQPEALYIRCWMVYSCQLQTVAFMVARQRGPG